VPAPVLVDCNVILDVATNDPRWYEWSAQALETAAERCILVVNPIVYAEVSIGYETIEDLERALPPGVFRRDALPYEAALLAGKAFLKYRRRGGGKKVPSPDFYLGAHAAIAGFRLLTRDAARYRTSFQRSTSSRPSDDVAGAASRRAGVVHDGSVLGSSLDAHGLQLDRTRLLRARVA
jgi:predicted nucleic acid-binding protein